jgi:hypothetical protein
MALINSEGGSIKQLGLSDAERADVGSWVEYCRIELWNRIERERKMLYTPQGTHWIEGNMKSHVDDRGKVHAALGDGSQRRWWKIENGPISRVHVDPANEFHLRKRLEGKAREERRLWRSRAKQDPPLVWKVVQERRDFAVLNKPRPLSARAKRLIDELQEQLAQLWSRPVRRCEYPLCERFFVGRSKDCMRCQDRNPSRKTRSRHRKQLTA